VGGGKKEKSLGGRLTSFDNLWEWCGWETEEETSKKKKGEKKKRHVVHPHLSVKTMHYGTKGELRGSCLPWRVNVSRKKGKGETERESKNKGTWNQTDRVIIHQNQGEKG